MALSFAIGMAAAVTLLASAGLGALIWLCPFWINPTPSVVPLLWGGACLGLWSLLCPLRAAQTATATSLNPSTGFIALLLALGLLILWRSPSLPNALAAALCLTALALAAQMAQLLTVRTIAIGWLAAALINSVIALGQYAGLTDEPPGTAFGLLRQRNQMATLCNIGLLALLYLAARARAEASTSLTKQLSGHALTWLLATALAATTSRVGVLELGLVVLLGWSKKKQRPLVISALVAYIIASWAMPQLLGSPDTILGRLLSTTQGLQLQDSRRLLWDNTVALIRSQPMLGVGWRELAQSLAMTDFAPSARFGAQADHAHNLPLQLAAELGLAAAALWLSALIAWMLWLLRRLKPWRSPDPATLLGWGVLAVIGIHSLLEYPLWYAPFQIATGLAVGILVQSTMQNDPHIGHRIGQRHPQPYSLARLTGIGLLAFCAYAAWDYFRVAQLFKPASERASLYRDYTMAKVEGTWLFAAQVNYAKLATTPVTPDNAKAMYALGQSVLHFSPEPSVFKMVIQAGELWQRSNGTADPALAQDLRRYRHQLRLIEAAADGG